MNFRDLSPEAQEAWRAAREGSSRRRQNDPPPSWASPFDSPKESMERAKRAYAEGRIGLPELEKILEAELARETT